jgi:hypothetical protein
MLIGGMATEGIALQQIVRIITVGGNVRKMILHSGRIHNTPLSLRTPIYNHLVGVVVAAPMRSISSPIRQKDSEP